MSLLPDTIVRMGPHRIRTVIPKSHRIEIDIPAEIPEGPADVEITVIPAASPTDEENRQAGLEMWLDEMRLLREKYAARDLRLSEAVIEERRQTG